MSINMSTVSRASFDLYRTSEYDANLPLTTWTKKITEDKDALSAWKQHMRPSPKDYRNFSNKNLWERFRAHFLLTLDSHDLRHLIDPAFRPQDEQLYASQQDWMFRGL